MISRSLKMLAAASSILCSTVSFAGSLDINLTDDSARINYTSDSVAVKDNTGVQWDAGLLYLEGEDDGDNAYLANLGVQTQGDPTGNETGQISLALGARVYGLDAGEISAASIALGGNVEVRIKSFDRIGFYAHAYYAPDIISFGDADATLEYGAKIGYEILRTSEVYVGYRHLSLDVAGGGDQTVDSSVVLGLRFDL